MNRASGMAAAVALGLAAAWGCEAPPVAAPPAGHPEAPAFRPSRAARSRREAEAAFRRLLRTPPAGRDARARLSLVVYNAGAAGAAVVERRLAGPPGDERRLARRLVSAIVTDGRAWHPHAGLVRPAAHEAFAGVAVRHVGEFVEGPAADVRMLYRLFATHVRAAAADVEHLPEVRDHPLVAWFASHEAVVAPGGRVVDEARRRQMTALWRKWAAASGATFERDLRSLHATIRRARAARFREPDKN